MRPIFIGGCPRSGTTLLGSMLGAHPRYLTSPESQFKIDLFNWAGPDGQVDGREALERLRKSARFRLWGLDFDEHVFRRSATPRELIEWIVRAYGRTVEKPDPAVWIDHTAAPNVQYAWTLSRAFPDASFVHIIRDGRAVAGSLLKVDWGSNDMEGAARFWLEKLGHGLGFEAAAPDGRVARVRYEDLVAEPESTLRRLCSRLDLEYHPEMIPAAGFSLPKYSSSTHQLIGRPPSSQRIDAWRHELTKRQIEIFESVAKETLDCLGYITDFGLSASPATHSERMRVKLLGLPRRKLNRVRKRWRFRRSIGMTLPSRGRTSESGKGQPA
jgi:hypothetical protein